MNQSDDINFVENYSKTIKYQTLFASELRITIGIFGDTGKVLMLLNPILEIAYNMTSDDFMIFFANFRNT